MAERSLSRAEQEVVIGKCADEDHWTIYSTDPVWTRRLTRIFEECGGRTIHHQGGSKFLLPVASTVVSIHKKRALSEEAREAAATRLRALRAQVGAQVESAMLETEDEEDLGTEGDADGQP